MNEDFRANKGLTCLIHGIKPCNQVLSLKFRKDFTQRFANDGSMEPKQLQGQGIGQFKDVVRSTQLHNDCWSLHKQIMQSLTLGFDTLLSLLAQTCHLQLATYPYQQ